jgi:hypothetical protein
MKPKFWYIKERHNPQFDKPYYTGLGRISQKEVKEYENPLYGFNVLLKFDNESDYKLKLVELTGARE